ncbi:MAG: hypothetical protein J6B45_05545 [Clostridia bacterium]|nr:hypothetical protein [Clostridia bacterium]
MSRIVSTASNEKFVVACTGGTVFVYDKKGNELAKFKGLKYAYLPVISPKGDILVVKSTEGVLAVYSLETLTLIKKLRTSKVSYAQDDGCCFSSDGKQFLNIERQIDDLHNALSVYDTKDFSRVSQWMLGEDMAINYIEERENEYYVIGFCGDESEICDTFFVGKYKNNSIIDALTIPEDEWWGCINERLVVSADVEYRSLADLWLSYREKKCDKR